MTDYRETFQRYLEGEVSPQEMAALCDWMAEDEEHARQLAGLSLLEIHLQERYLLLCEGAESAEADPRNAEPDHLPDGPP